VTDLTLAQKASLLTGATFWSTASFSELGIGEVVLADGPNGVRRQLQGTDHLGLYHSEPATCFPPAVAIGSSWSRDVAAAVGRALAIEARALGVDILLGPGVNIKRSPLGGRNFEYYSEDPLLSGVLASAYVESLQAGGVGASLKHFVANDQETDRMVISSDVDDRTLREVYLAPFERVITESKPATVMCSYNKINGIHAAENRWLLNDVLREEWGFEGAVVSDWGAIRTRPAALAAGLDLGMPGPGEFATAAVIGAVEAGEIDEATVDDAAARVLALAAYSNSDRSTADWDAHHDLARRLAVECAVLLKNENNTLPINQGASILVVGEFAKEPRYQGGGSSHVNATRVDIPLDEMRILAEECDVQVAFAQGFQTDSAENETLRAHAVAAARLADTVIVFAGNPESEESEGFDRSRLELPESQTELINALAEVARRVVVVLANGGVVTLEGWHDRVDAILEGFLLGQGGGKAIADILFGAENPSGHLAETIPVRLEDTPAWLTFPGEQGHVRYGEGVMVGHRYFVTADRPVRYPFGHGLSYTTFSTDSLAVDVTAHDSLEATVTVTNTGSRAGAHVVQVYLSTGVGPVIRPRRILAGFDKIHLEPGQSKHVVVELDRRVLGYWDIDRKQLIVSPGLYTVQVAESASTVLLEQTVEVDGDFLPVTLTLQSETGSWLDDPVAGPQLRARMQAVIGSSGEEPVDGSDGTAMMRGMPMNQILSILGGAIDGDWLLSLVAQPETGRNQP